MDLGEPGNEKNDAIGEAKKKGKTEVVSLLERFKVNPTQTKSEIRKELKITGEILLLFFSSSFFLILRLLLWDELRRCSLPGRRT